MNSEGLTKRRFLFLTAAGAATVIGGFPRTLSASPAGGEIPYRPLGRTGVKVSSIGLGGFHLGNVKDRAESIRMVRSAVDRGINFMDNCWDYHEGDSERRMGEALRDGYRDKVFLMTKIDGRTKSLAARQIDECLQRLQTDHVDLMQLHEFIRVDDPDRVFASGGAVEAVQEAQKAGKVRFIGFTGHKSPDIHVKTLLAAAKAGLHFDTVQMPLNVMDAHFESFEKKVLPALVKQDIGILGMKPLGGGFILKTKAVTPLECLHYALNLPTSVVITGCESMADLDQAIDAAKSFRPLSGQQVASLLARTADLARKGAHERYKTTEYFDATARNPDWLG